MHELRFAPLAADCVTVHDPLRHVMIFRTLFPACLLAFLTCTPIICGSACDFDEPGQCHGLGGMFGPCDDHLAFLCVNGLECLVADEGRICVPRLSAPGFEQDSAEMCSMSVGGEFRCDRGGDRCFTSCADVPCALGTICDDGSGVCVYPDKVPPPHKCGDEGQLFGPCPPDTHLCAPGLICLDSLPEGTICGVDDQEAWGGLHTIACAAEVGVKAPTCDFFNDDCYSPCTSDAECLGGTVCSQQWGACVWPTS